MRSSRVAAEAPARCAVELFLGGEHNVQVPRSSRFLACEEPGEGEDFQPCVACHPGRPRLADEFNGGNATFGPKALRIVCIA